MTLREDNIRFQSKLKPIIAPLTPLAHKLHDGKGGFRDNVSRDLVKGILPTGDALAITIEILATESGTDGIWSLRRLFKKVKQEIDEI